MWVRETAQRPDDTKTEEVGGRGRCVTAARAYIMGVNSNMNYNFEQIKFCCACTQHHLLPFDVTSMHCGTSKKPALPFVVIYYASFFSNGKGAQRVAQLPIAVVY